MFVKILIFILHHERCLYLNIDGGLVVSTLLHIIILEELYTCRLLDGLNVITVIRVSVIGLHIRYT